jgi:hypothetical protein
MDGRCERHGFWADRDARCQTRGQGPSSGLRGFALSMSIAPNTPKRRPENRSWCSSLRAGDVQEALPPTVHPGTGKPYTWLTPPNSEFPLLPEALLEPWKHWESYRKEVEAMCLWAEHGFNPEPAPRGGRT